jgi:dipeptide/tripeptide permease
VPRSVFAPIVTESFEWLVPIRFMVPALVNVAVGELPMSPVMLVVPVLVIPEYARTAKLSAVPRLTNVAAWLVGAMESINPVAANAMAEKMEIFLVDSLIFRYFMSVPFMDLVSKLARPIATGFR